MELGLCNKSTQAPPGTGKCFKNAVLKPSSYSPENYNHLSFSSPLPQDSVVYTYSFAWESLLLEWMSWNLKNRNEVWNESTLFLLEILVICAGDLCLAGSRSIHFYLSITDCQRWGCSDRDDCQISVCRFHPTPTPMNLPGVSKDAALQRDKGRQTGAGW